MNPGELNQRIEIQKYNSSVDSTGYESKTWSKLIGCWAKVENLSGKEIYKADKENSLVTKIFTVRYNLLIVGNDTKNIRILYKNKYYDVKYINDEDFKNQYIEIIGELTNGG